MRISAAAVPGASFSFGTLRKLMIVGLAAMIGTVSPSARSAESSSSESFRLTLRRQEPGDGGATWYRTIESRAVVDAAATALIICDVWDEHHCHRAVQRLTEFAPRIAAIADAVRNAGGAVIHAPSDCMPAYQEHPARARAITTAAEVDRLRIPPDAADWCCRLPSEVSAEYPLDQSRGGEDDAPEEHAAWTARLASIGRNTGTPWRSQSPLVPIDGERDFVTDSGEEVAAILEAREIRHVLLAGVHLNMCVLGRPFGLRRQVLAGKEVSLVRDLTDTMFDPAEWPWVDHFTATDRMVDHVERHICSTVASSDLLGGPAFRSPRDKRPTVAIVVAESEYGSHETLPAFAARYLGDRFRVVTHHVANDDAHSIPGLQRLSDADVLMLSVRRRGLLNEEMQSLRDWITSGRPIVAIRTASHAWEPRDAPDGRSTWAEFDRDVLGVEYTGHFGNDAASIVTWRPSSGPVLAGLDRPIRQVGSLYKIAPASGRTRVLAVGTVEGEPPQPVVTSFIRPDGGLSLYTSLGHRDDLARPEVAKLLVNAVHVAAGVAPPAVLDPRDPSDPWIRWVSTQAPLAAGDLLASWDGRREGQGSHSAWLRCVIVPGPQACDGVSLDIPAGAGAPEVWLDGSPLAGDRTDEGNETPATSDVAAAKVPRTTFRIQTGQLLKGRPALIVVAFPAGCPLPGAAIIAAIGNAPDTPLDRVQVRLVADGTDRKDLVSMPLPAQFGGSADAVVVLP